MALVMRWHKYPNNALRWIPVQIHCRNGRVELWERKEEPTLMFEGTAALFKSLIDRDYIRDV